MIDAPQPSPASVFEGTSKCGCKCLGLRSEFFSRIADKEVGGYERGHEEARIPRLPRGGRASEIVCRGE